MREKSSSRVAFVDGLIEVAERDRRAVFVAADSVKAMRATRFQELFPDRLFDVGIAEQNAVAFAAGMASCGLMPFFGTYAGFITTRACEQLRTFVAYPGLNVKFVGANGGIYCGEREGVTHQFFEDLGILRSIPDMTIVVPADASEVKAATIAVAEMDGPAYIRVGSGREPVVFEDELPFELGKARVLVENGNDLTIFANGFVMSRVLDAIEILKDEGIGATLVEVHTLKPLDADTIAEALAKTGAAVTVEDHNIIGGLGSAVAEVIAERVRAPLIRIGLQDVFPISGEAEAVLDYFGVGVADIVEAAKKVLTSK